MAIVRFESIVVTNSGATVSFLDEAWNVFLDANGGAASVPNPLQTQDGRQFAIGAGGEVTVPLHQDTVIRVQCSGVFNPNSFIQGSLPGAVRSHGSADGWGLGGSFALEASNSERSYEVHYSISCLTQRVASVVSRAAALRVVTDTLFSMGAKAKISEDAALSLFMGRIGRHGFSVRAVQGDDVLVDGPTDIHYFLKQALATEIRGQASETKGRGK